MTGDRTKIPASTLAGAGLALITLALLIFRIHLGADYTDESQYAAQTMGPLIGGRPFATDLLFQQSASLLMTPLGAIYLAIRGDMDGIVLFLRWMYVAGTIATAFAFYVGLRDRLSRAARWMLIAGIFAHVPFCMPSPSYNSLGILFLIASLSLAFSWWDRPGRVVGAVVGVLTSLALFSYPTLIFAYLPLAPFLFRRPRGGWILIASLATVFFLTGFVLQSGFDNLRAAYEVTRGVSLMGFWQKIAVHQGALVSLFPGTWWLSVAAAAAVIALALRRYDAEVGLCLAALASFGALGQSGLPLYFTTLVYAVPFVVLGEIAKPRWFHRPVFSFENAILISPILAGLITGWSSGNGLMNAALGFSVAILFAFARSLTEKRPLTIFTWIALLGIWCTSNFTYFYREAPLAQLTEPVRQGPFTGLYTSAARVAWLDRFAADFRVIPPEARSIFFFDQFPAGYLFSERTPKTFLYFMHPAYYTPWLRPRLIDFFSNPENLPDAAVQFFQLPMSNDSFFRIADANSNLLNDPFWDYFARHPDYVRVLENGVYAIYLKKIPIHK